MHARVVLGEVDVFCVQSTFLFVEFGTQELVRWPNLVDVCLSPFGHHLSASRWATWDYATALAVARRDHILSVLAHTHAILSTHWIDNVILHDMGFDRCYAL